MFFDDNIERDRAHIVDVRDCQSFFPLPFAQTQHTCLLRVEPYQAITDRMYYVKAVQAVIDKHRHEKKK
ncbi:hypothetical protein EON65_00590 [archaeon]|nr:MAG: hypothetical protein EON65_00590 [archaeon]